MEMAELLAREGIRDTLSRYNLAGDRGRIDELADCFTADGTLEVEGAWSASGRDEIRRHTRGTADAASAARRAPLLRHHLTTQRIELYEDVKKARAWSYFLVLSENGPDHAGRYIDRLSLDEGVWRIEHRRVVVEWQAPETAYPLLRSDPTKTAR